MLSSSHDTASRHGLPKFDGTAPSYTAWRSEFIAWAVLQASMKIASLDALTTPAAIEKFKELYVKCVVRDTPDAGRAAELAREKVTLD